MPAFIVASAAGTTTATLPAATATNDVVFAFAYRSLSATAPTLPTSWTSVLTRVTSPAILVARRVKDGTWTATPTFTGATQTHIIVIRGQDLTTPAGASSSGGATAQNIAVSALTTQQKDMRLLVLRGMVHERPDQAIAAPALHASLQASGTQPGYGTFVTYAPDAGAATFNTARSDVHSWAQVEVRGASARILRPLLGVGTG